jgi:hypothetical protein
VIPDSPVELVRIVFSPEAGAMALVLGVALIILFGLAVHGLVELCTQKK